MKKKISILLCAIMMCNVLSATAFATETPTENISNNNEEIVLELDYMDFYENQDYYMSLVRDHNYTLHFDPGEEYLDLELARIAENAAASDTLTPVVSRGTTAPTQGHDITKGKLTFNGKSSYSDLYTNKYCTGSSWYVVTLLNHTYTSRMLKVTAYNVLSSQQVTNFSSGTTVKKYTMSGSGATAPTKHFYLKFTAPVDASGYIERGYKG